MNNKNKKIIEDIKNGLILSCQVKKTDPLYLPEIIEKLVACGEWGDACGYRIDTPENIIKVRKITNKPIIGLWKINMETEDVFITPSMKEVDEIVNAGADIVAVDATNRVNSYGRKAYELIPEIKEKYPDLLILADIRNAEEAREALKIGAHMVAPTLYRFNDNPKSTDSPDFEELARIVEACEGLGFVIMEGKITSPEEAIQSLYLGAHAVVFGSAITRPHLSTLRFTSIMNKYKRKIPLKY